MMRVGRDVFIITLFTLVLGFVFSDWVGPYEQTILALCGINIILAVSLNLVNGFTGQFSLGHAGFMAVGAYTSAALTTLYISPEYVSGGVISHLVFVVALLVGGVSAGIVGFLVGVPSLRLRGDYLAIVTLGFGEIIRVIILNIEAIGGARGIGGIPGLTNLYWVIGVCIVSTLALHRLLKSIPGQQFMAVRDDETATLAMGLSTTRIKVRSFVFSSFLAGVAGALFAHYYQYLNPSTFTFNYSFQIVAMVVLGGMGSLSGSILSAVGLTVLLEGLRELQTITQLDLRMVLYSLILIVVMLTRPRGLLGRKEIWEYLPVSLRKGVKKSS